MSSRLSKAVHNSSIFAAAQRQSSIFLPLSEVQLRYPRDSAPKNGHMVKEACPSLMPPWSTPATDAFKDWYGSAGSYLAKAFGAELRCINSVRYSTEDR